MIGCEYCLSVKLQLKIKDFNKTCFVQSDFIKTFRGVDQQHKKVIIHKFFMSIERIDAKCVNGNMMPAAELQQTEKATNICLFFFIAITADATVVDTEFIGKRMIFHPCV